MQQIMKSTSLKTLGLIFPILLLTLSTSCGFFSSSSKDDDEEIVVTDVLNSEDWNLVEGIEPLYKNQVRERLSTEAFIYNESRQNSLSTKGNWILNACPDQLTMTNGIRKDGNYLIVDLDVNYNCHVPPIENAAFPTESFSEISGHISYELFCDGEEIQIEGLSVGDVLSKRANFCTGATATSKREKIEYRLKAKRKFNYSQKVLFDYIPVTITYDEDISYGFSGPEEGYCETKILESGTKQEIVDCRQLLKISSSNYKKIKEDGVSETRPEIRHEVYKRLEFHNTVYSPQSDDPWYLSGSINYLFNDWELKIDFSQRGETGPKYEGKRVINPSESEDDIISDQLIKL